LSSRTKQTPQHMQNDFGRHPEGAECGVRGVRRSKAAATGDLDWKSVRLQEALISPKKILVDAKLEHDIVKNYKLLQAAFMKKNINKVTLPLAWSST
jgi:hypothetical protein